MAATSVKVGVGAAQPFSAHYFRSRVIAARRSSRPSHRSNEPAQDEGKSGLSNRSDQFDTGFRARHTHSKQALSYIEVLDDKTVWRINRLGSYAGNHCIRGEQSRCHICGRPMLLKSNRLSHNKVLLE